MVSFCTRHSWPTGYLLKDAIRIHHQPDSGSGPGSGFGLAAVNVWMPNIPKRWQTRPGLAESMRDGLAVPILSDGAIFDLAVGHPQPLAQAMA